MKTPLPGALEHKQRHKDRREGTEPRQDTRNQCRAAAFTRHFPSKGEKRSPEAEAKIQAVARRKSEMKLSDAGCWQSRLLTVRGQGAGCTGWAKQLCCNSEQKAVTQQNAFQTNCRSPVPMMSVYGCHMLTQNSTNAKAKMHHSTHNECAQKARSCWEVACS